MLKKTLLLTLTICAAAVLAINQPVHSQINEFELTAGDGRGGELVQIQSFG